MSLKQKIGRIANQILQPAGYEITRRYSSDQRSFPISRSMIEESIRQCVTALESAAMFFTGTTDRLTLESYVRAYFELSKTCPMNRGYGSSGFNTGMLLFVVARLRNPDMILESGTFEGFSSWYLRNACPSADIHCYDLTFEKLLYRDPSIHYHSHDWAQGSLGFEVPENSLFFFDDHVNQAQRIIEAKARGGKWLILDDDVPTHALHRDGLPPVPTMSMLFDASLEDGDVLEWVSDTRPMSYHHAEAFARQARAAVAAYQRAPDLYEQTGFPSTRVAFVELC